MKKWAVNAGEVVGTIIVRIVKTLMGDGASFSCIRKGELVISYRGMVFAKMFYGEMVLFSGGMASPRIPPQLEYWA